MSESEIILFGFLSLKGKLSLQTTLAKWGKFMENLFKKEGFIIETAGVIIFKLVS